MTRPLRPDESPQTVLTFIGLVAFVAAHQPTAEEVCGALGISLATLKRRIALARSIGVQIACRREKTRHYYVVEAFGPFSRDGLIEFEHRNTLPDLNPCLTRGE